MKCPHCGAQMGLEDEVCPYCGAPNTFATQHQSDMAHFRQEYQLTQADVAQRTSFLQRHGSWLVVLTVALVAFFTGIMLNVFSWDIGYEIRSAQVQRSAVEDRQMLNDYLAHGDYGKFVGYYDANEMMLSDDNSYQGVLTAARSYVDLLEYVSAINNSSEFRFQPKYISDTCAYIAEDLNRVYTLEDQYSYNAESYLPEEMRGYIQDIRARTAVLAKTYFGLTDEQISEIPNISEKRLAVLIEEGMAS